VLSSNPGNEPGAYLNEPDEWSDLAFGLIEPWLAAPECLPGTLVAHPIEGHIMVVIRLSRGGSKKRPFYNIVVAEQNNRRDGRFLERVGFYNPLASGNAERLRVAFDRVDHWVGVGAQASDTVTRLLADAKKAAPAA
jgi:small subunit ribosomal protein S16